MKPIAWTILDLFNEDTWPAEDEFLTFVCKTGSHVARMSDPCLGEFVRPGGDMVSLDDDGSIIEGTVMKGACTWGTFYCQHGFMEWEEVYCWRYTSE
jgi:hypothetical protein